MSKKVPVVVKAVKDKKIICKYQVFASKYLLNFLDKATIVNIGGITKGLGNTLASLTNKLCILVS